MCLTVGQFRRASRDLGDDAPVRIYIDARCINTDEVVPIRCNEEQEIVGLPYSVRIGVGYSFWLGDLGDSVARSEIAATSDDDVSI